MYSFNNDYNEVCCPEILKRLSEISNEQFPGYSLDKINDSAKQKIKDLCKTDCDVHFIVGGTQTNQIFLTSCLKNYQAVIAVETGHINVHETGAIEATGHKVLTTKGKDGKVIAEEVEKVVIQHTDEHMVQPKCVYISNSTEIGTIYHLDELKQLRAVCDKYNLYLYMDGARLGSALTSEDNDLSIDKIATYVDAFYIGGTKNGAMFGEALILINNDLKKDFRYYIKQRGGMLAKGFLLGVQFDELFKNDLFFKLAKHENQMAQKIQDALIDKGYELLIKSPTNQIFPIINNQKIEQLQKEFEFSIWEPGEKASVIRLVTNFNSQEDKVDELINSL